MKHGLSSDAEGCFVMPRVFRLTEGTCVGRGSGAVCNDQCPNLAGNSIPVRVTRKLHIPLWPPDFHSQNDPALHLSYSLGMQPSTI